MLTYSRLLKCDFYENVESHTSHEQFLCNVYLYLNLPCNNCEGELDPGHAVVNTLPHTAYRDILSLTVFQHVSKLLVTSTAT